MKKKSFSPLMLSTLFLVSGCAGFAPLPGGRETLNQNFYKSEEDFRRRVDMIHTGMREADVMAYLGRNRRDFKTLNRSEVMAVVFGANTIQVLESASRREEVTNFMRGLYGFKLEYKDVTKELGFENPIRLRTDEAGFAYTVNLVFKDGVLFSEPDVSGGTVKGTSSNTLFEGISFGSIVNRVQ